MTQSARSRAALAVLEVLLEHACVLSASLSLRERIDTREELRAIEAWLQARAAEPPPADHPQSAARGREVIIKNNSPV